MPLALPPPPGVATGRAVFDSDRAAEFASHSGEPAILVRPDTSTADVVGFAASAEILTASGGRTAHAAVVARQLGKACIVGCPGLSIDVEAGRAEIAGHAIGEGNWLSIDGESGEVFLGKRRIVTTGPKRKSPKSRAGRERRRAGDIEFEGSTPHPVLLGKLAKASLQLEKIRIRKRMRMGRRDACTTVAIIVPSPRGRG